MRNGMFRVLGRSSAIYKLHMKTLEMSPSCRLFQFWFAVFELLNLLFSPIVGPTAFMNCREFPASMAPTGILCLEPWDERTSCSSTEGPVWDESTGSIYQCRKEKCRNIGFRIWVSNISKIFTVFCFCQINIPVWEDCFSFSAFFGRGRG